jgi:hypothetical protein
VLNSRREPRVETLTRNVLNGLSIGEPAEWATFGGQITSTPVLGLNLDGRLELYARSYDGFARHVWQGAPNGLWANWASEGGSLAGNGNTETTLAMARNKDGRLDVFARGTNNAVWHITQTAPNTGWSSLGGTFIGDPACGANSDGCLEVFTRGPQRTLWHRWQTSPGNW